MPELTIAGEKDREDGVVSAGAGKQLVRLFAGAWVGWRERGRADRARQAGKNHGAVRDGANHTRAPRHSHAVHDGRRRTGRRWRAIARLLWAAGAVPSTAFFVA